MTLVVAGVSHHACPVELRERLHFPEAELSPALLRLRKRLDGAGAVILSTCNRVEVYVSHADPPDELFAAIRAFLSESRDVPETEFSEHLYQYEGLEAVGHLFRVACGLDSLVVGEAQILGQVHDAYLRAQTEASTDKVLSALFQKGFALAKDVRTNTGIAAGKVSIGSVAVELAVSIFMNLSGKTAMIVGSGEMGELALKSLVSNGIGKVILVNRSVEKAQELARELGGEPLGLDELHRRLHHADIVITSTGAQDYLLRVADLQRALKLRGQAPIFIIDISVPRNVDPAVNDLDNVYIYDIDDLRQIADKNLDARRRELDACLTMVENRAEQFWRWKESLVAEPTIVSMAAELHSIRERELHKTLNSLPDLTDKQRDEVEYLTKRIVNTILQRPMSQLKQEVIGQDPHNVLHLVKRLFGLKEVT